MNSAPNRGSAAKSKRYNKNTTVEHDDYRAEAILKLETITMTGAQHNRRVKTTGFYKDGTINYDSGDEERKKRRNFYRESRTI